jgi:ribonuclease D
MVTDYITDSQALAALCARLAHENFVTVDTEFLRETTFWPKVCLIQIAGAEEVCAIDPLVPGLDLAPFLALMADRSVVKVFHAARQDIEIIWKLSGQVPTPLFDTQVAAMVCGFGDQVSYGDLVRQICGVDLDKSMRFTDWSRRPLSAAHMDYALADVTFLRTIYEALRQRLDQEGRDAWLNEEMAVLTAPATYAQEPAHAWERLAHRLRKPRDLAILRELAAWRETEAQARDVPRGRILKDDALVDIAQAAPRTSQSLSALRLVPGNATGGETGAAILAAVERGLACPPDALPKVEKPRRGGGGATAPVVELLKVLLRHVSESQGVAPRLIASGDDLDALARDDAADVPALHGWRAALFGHQALALKQGRLAIAIKEGRTHILPVENTPFEG